MFDYLDYKNKIPLNKCTVPIPRLNPNSMNYKKFWNGTMKRKQIEGHWVSHEGEYQWIPGVIIQYCNLWRIERKKEDGTAKGKVIGKPDLRDIEWIKGYIYSVARGFSGFEDDDEITCHRVLLDEQKDLIIPYLPKKIRESLYNSKGELKEYKDALKYLYEYKTKSLGKPLFYNSAKNVLEIGARNYGKDVEENTLVHGEFGKFPIKNIKVGDRIYDEKGQLTTVISRFDFDDQIQYEIKLKDVESTVLCGDGHRWLIKTIAGEFVREFKDFKDYKDHILLPYKESLTGYVKWTSIESITEIGVKPSICIEVNNESHLFLIEDYIVTHNTMFSANICGHNFLTDGITDYDEWFENSLLPKDEKVTYTTQTLIGAIDAKYVNNLTKHLKVGLDHLPGSTKSGNITYPAPLSKKFMGSFTVGKDIIARYEEKIGGEWEWKGSGSGFSMRSFNDNPYAANGLRYGLGLIDEVGFMGNLLDTLGQLHECTTVDGEKYGTIWMTGTGGDMVSGATEAAMKVFYDGDSQECLTFDDVFENKGKIGFFVPAWMALSEYRDDLGNINKELALNKLLKEREKAANASTKDALYNLLQMKPLKPSEAFLVLEGNIFPIGELKEHLSNLETNEKAKDLGNTGMMRRDESGKAIFKVDHSLRAADYPTNSAGSSNGCVVVWEEPIDNPPYGLYIAGIDPYDQDKVTNSVSFGSIIIYKRFYSAEQTYHLPVAEYTGRPEFANDFYEQCRRLLEWYNAKALYENQNGGIKKYFETQFCTYLLHEQPGILKHISPKSSVNRGYGIHMTTPIKNELEIMTRDWLKTETAPGIMRLTQIKSIPLLKELIAYNETGNFDRVIAFMLCIMQDIEMHRVKVDEIKQENIDKFFEKKLYM